MEIQNNVAYLAALSMAAERLVAIIRGLPWFAFAKNPAAPAETKQAVQDEAQRAAKVNTLAVIAGIITAALAFEIGVLPVAKTWPEVVIFGVLAGAGSGFWNAVLSYIIQLKNAVPSKAQVVVEGRAAGAGAGGHR